MHVFKAKKRRTSGSERNTVTLTFIIVSQSGRLNDKKERNNNKGKRKKHAPVLSNTAAHEDCLGV
jgi:hypothetical protein